MRIVMIRPNIGMLELKNGEDVPFDDKGRMEPLQLGVLAGLTPDDIDVKLYDDRIEEINYEAPVDLVAISVEIFTARRSYEIAAEFRRRNKMVVLGGIHASTLPDEAALYADSVIVGDAESVWKTVLDDFKAGALKSRYVSGPGVPHPGRIPRRSIFTNKMYFPMSLLQYGRGCPYTCSFCSTGQYFNGLQYVREIDEVINEIKCQKRKLLFFVDDNIVGDKQKAKMLFKALIPLKIRWIGQASIDMTDDLELMKLMQLSGCIGLVIGFESYTTEGLKAYNKTPNNTSNYDWQIDIIRKHKIHIWAAFVLGHDEETVETLQETLDFAIRKKFSFAAFNILMPYPKTQLYEMLKNENRLLYDGKWWLSKDYRFNYAAFGPKNMSHEELTLICNAMRKKYNSFPVIMKRMLARHNLLNYSSLRLLWNMVWLFRRETFKKYGMKLGFSRN